MELAKEEHARRRQRVAAPKLAGGGGGGGGGARLTLRMRVVVSISGRRGWQWRHRDGARASRRRRRLRSNVSPYTAHDGGGDWNLLRGSFSQLHPQDRAQPSSGLGAENHVGMSFALVVSSMKFARILKQLTFN